ncbi:MAG: hypothetical protein AB7S26_01625 [Sandaracinaceae bacterium]
MEVRWPALGLFVWLLSACGVPRLDQRELCERQETLVGQTIMVEVDVPGTQIGLHEMTGQICDPGVACCNGASYVYLLRCAEGPVIRLVPSDGSPHRGEWTCSGMEPPCEPEDCPGLTTVLEGRVDATVLDFEDRGARNFLISDPE